MQSATVVHMLLGVTLYILRALAAVVSDVLLNAFHLQNSLYDGSVQDSALLLIITITDIDRYHINGVHPDTIVNSNNKQTNKTTSPP